ncbi:alpha/beta fold hydrolase [Luteococcus sp. Sow4_B9]|uniref:alpha/beta fold hydrolase n=1 Tax=Luteococcus sp. Sow4_B9 TaxID=3438792 RepID=UPI003F9CA604
MGAFLPTLGDHDREAAISAYVDLPAVVVNGSAGLVVPPADSAAIARALGCRHVVVPRAGHNVMMAAPEKVTNELRSLAERVREAGQI